MADRLRDLQQQMSGAGLTYRRAMSDWIDALRMEDQAAAARCLTIYNYRAKEYREALAEFLNHLSSLDWSSLVQEAIQQARQI